MRVDKIAKMLIGVENLVVQGVAYDEEQGCIVISARPTLPHARECGKCGRKAPFYDAGRGRRRWRCMDLGGMRCYYSGNKTIGEKRQSGRIRARGCASWEVPAPIL